jgi:transcriptional regulator
MYVPEAFAETRLPVLHAAIRAAGLATLVSAGSGGVEASHVPLVLVAEEGAQGTLYGHFARANAHWRTLEAGGPALALFMGPDGYVSPAWYPSKARDGRAVPTWNYVAVHARGPVEIFHDASRLRQVVERLSERHEAGRPDPWQVSDAPPDYVAAMLKGIVGFRLPIESLEGKWKLSQNHPAENRNGVIAALDAAGSPLAAVMPRPEPR